MKQVEHFILFEIVVFFLPPARFLYLTLDVAKVNMVFTTSRNVEKKIFLYQSKKIAEENFWWDEGSSCTSKMGKHCKNPLRDSCFFANHKLSRPTLSRSCNPSGINSQKKCGENFTVCGRKNIEQIHES